MKYTVKRGDTLSKIAKLFGVSVSEIQKANPIIKSPNIISIGWVLEIPTKTETSKDERIGKAFRKAMEDVEKLDSVNELLSLL